MKFESNLNDVLKTLKDKESAAAEAVGQFATGRAKLNSPVALIDGGNLRSSNDYKVEETLVTIGNSAEYAGFVEKGTRHMAAQPFLEPAVTNNRNEIKSLVERYLKG